MKNRYVITALITPLLLLSANCFATSACEQIKDYYNKSPHEIKHTLEGMKPDDLLDVKFFSTRCRTESPVNFSIGGIAADETVMHESANNIFDLLTEKDKEDKAKATEGELKGFNFSAGLGMLYLNDRSDIISTMVDNNFLRVTNEEKYKLGLWLSSHTYFNSGEWNLNPFGWPDTDHLKFKPNGNLEHCETNCWGLFVAAQLGGDGNSLVNAMALGIAYTPTRKSQKAVAQGQSRLVFEFGWGVTHIQTLADGYTEGMTLTPGNQPVMKRTIGRGPVLIVSYDID